MLPIADTAATNIFIATTTTTSNSSTTGSSAMVASFATIACLCFLSSQTSTPVVVEGFVAAPSSLLPTSWTTTVQRGAISSQSTAAAVAAPVAPVCRQSQRLSKWKNKSSGGAASQGREEQGLTRMAASSNSLNGAGLSQQDLELSRLDGAEAETPETPSVGGRVRRLVCRGSD